MPHKKPVIFTMQDCIHCTNLKQNLGKDCAYFEFRDTTGEKNKNNLDMALSYGIKLMPSLVYWQDGKQCIVENPDASFVRSLITEMPLIQTFDTQETNDGNINNETIS